MPHAAIDGLLVCAFMFLAVMLAAGVLTFIEVKRIRRAVEQKPPPPPGEPPKAA